jgi:Protein NO VEIN, C-terminal
VATWVYKCNRRGTFGPERGDWEFVFASATPVAWGPPSSIPALDDLRPGDLLLCYQTDRNLLVGLARVTGFRGAGRGRRVVVQALRRIGTKVRPLKMKDRRIGRIPALQGGRIQTIYPISTADADLLVRSADKAATQAIDRAARQASTDSGENIAAQFDKAQGFEADPRIRSAIERHAVRRAKAWYRKRYRVRERGKPYDLHCTRNGKVLLVEVKGTRSSGQGIILTTNEVDLARRERMELFVLHSVRIVKSKSKVRAVDGIERVITPWRPSNKQLRPIAYECRLGSLSSPQ